MKPYRKRAAPTVRWTPSLKSLRALSIRQTWAWLIVNGYKDVENRGWATKYRGPLPIHAGASRDGLRHAEAWVARRFRIRLPAEYDFGGIVGVVNLLDCSERNTSPWHDSDSIGWVLARARRLPFRRVKGALSLFGPRFRQG